MRHYRNVQCNAIACIAPRPMSVASRFKQRPLSFRLSVLIQGSERRRDLPGWHSTFAATNL